jgi:RNA polymerase sigma-B factor
MSDETREGLDDAAAEDIPLTRVEQTRQESAALFVRLRDDDADQGRRDAARDALVHLHLPLVEHCARRFRNRGEPFEDLVQVGTIGLLKSVDRFDTERGVEFSTYATPTIIGEIKRHFRDHTWDLHVPRRVQEIRNKVRTAIRELAVADLGRSPTVAQIAAHTKLSEEDVLTGMEAIESFRALSLEARIGRPGSDDYSLADTLGWNEGRYDTVLAREAVRPYLAELPERERRILHLRFFHDMTQSRIGEELGMSQMHVSRLLSRACTRVRERVDGDAAGQEPAPVTA